MSEKPVENPFARAESKAAKDGYRMGLIKALDIVHELQEFEKENDFEVPLTIVAKRISRLCKKAEL